MPFGRYRLPDAYLGWLFSLEDLREPLRSAVDREWYRRVSAGPSTALATLPVEAGPIADERRHHPATGGDHESMVLLNRAVVWLRQAVRSAA